MAEHSQSSNLPSKSSRERSIASKAAAKQKTPEGMKFFGLKVLEDGTTYAIYEMEVR